MTKLIRFLKPFRLLILTAILLLYAQAMADLALPDYMSQIVNTGIQQNGIEQVIPERIAADDLEKFLLFTSDEEASRIRSLYQLDPESNAFYLAGELSDDEIANLEPLFSRILLAFNAIEDLMEAPGVAPLEFNGMSLPADTDLFEILESMPVDSRIALIDEQMARFGVLDSDTLVQMGAQALGAYYGDNGIDLLSIQRRYILRVGGIMLLVTLFGALASIAVGFIASRTAAGVGRNLRQSLFNKVQRFSEREFDTFSTASLITRSTNDVTQIQNMLVMMIRIIFYAPIMGVGGVFKALDKSPSMSWIIALAVLLLILMILSIFRIAMPKFKLIQKLVDRLNRVMRENLTGIMVIRAFNTQTFEEARFDAANQDLTDTNLFVNRIMVFLSPAMMLIMNGTSLLIVWIGAHQIEASTLLVGDMMAFMQYAMQIIFSFLMLSMMFIMVPRAVVSAQRITEVLDTAPTVLDPKTPTPINKTGAGEVEFRHVEFQFPGAEEPLLKDINFTAHPGKTTAIIGATGSGKSTLVNLLPRFYDITGGEILIDGIDIRALSLYDLRDRIGYIPQKAVLFSGTIESNLRYGREDASMDDLEEVIRIAQARDILNERETGFQATISQDGANLSGGQKQRLSIARALAKNPEILIIDDSFSALDFKTDSELRRALAEKPDQSTLLLVAQRIATIQHADQIIVLENGGICGIGRHEELMEKCTTYREIALSQLSAEELA